MVCQDGCVMQAVTECLDRVMAKMLANPYIYAVDSPETGLPTKLGHCHIETSSLWIENKPRYTVKLEFYHPKAISFYLRIIIITNRPVMIHGSIDNMVHMNWCLQNIKMIQKILKRIDTIKPKRAKSLTKDS